MEVDEPALVEMPALVDELNRLTIAPVMQTRGGKTYLGIKGPQLYHAALCALRMPLA